MVSSRLGISGETAVYGLIGDPVDHSLSPAIQNAAFQRAGINAVYVPFLVKRRDLRDAVHGLRGSGVRGFNVMAPYKILVLKHLESLDSSARASGSVNTVVRVGNELRGYNTDGLGAVNALEEAGVSPNGKDVLIFGAGGAGRAIALSLASRAGSIRLANRTVGKTRQVVRRIRRTFGLDASYTSLSSKLLRCFVEQADILVNASSMGIDGRNNVPVHEDWLSPNQCVFDVVYKPVKTRLLELARLAGATAVTGLDMLVNQGACSFELWTGRKASRVEMRHAIAQRLLVIEHAKSS